MVKIDVQGNAVLVGSTNIEIVVVRHPDAGTDVTVFEDGRDVTASRGISVTVIDPGAGYELHDWLAAQRSALASASEAAARAIADGYDSYADSGFIQTENTCMHEDDRTGEVCGASLDDGEGFDGLCGTHADQAEQE